MLEQVFFAIFVAVLVAVLGYLKNKPKEEEFEIFKITATVLVGILVGMVVYLTDLPVNEESIAAMLAEYAGLILLVEYILKIIWRWSTKPKKELLPSNL